MEKITKAVARRYALTRKMTSAAKTCSYELKISKKIEIKYEFYLKHLLIYLKHFKQVA